MIEDAKIETVAPRLMAAVREQVFSTKEIVPKLFASLDKVWPFLRANPSIKQEGINIAVYRNDPDKNLLETAEGLPMDCGVAVTEPFAEAPPIRCLATPGGRVIGAKLVGPYSEIGNAHEAARNAARVQNLKLAGPCWEVYGHWTEDVSKLATQIYYLLE